MPVDDHPVHPSTKKGPDFRYGCWNRAEYKDAYRAPQRRHGSNGYIAIFEYEAVLVPNRMSRECMTAKTGWAATDPCCEGCERRYPKP